MSFLFLAERGRRHDSVCTCNPAKPCIFRALARDSYVGKYKAYIGNLWVPTRVTHFGHYDPISVAIIIRTRILNASAGYCLSGRADKNFHANYRELRPLSLALSLSSLSLVA